jgi:hypothetical protein
MRRDDWTVGDEGIRTAGKPDECFYCHAKRGAQHSADCVIRSRTVVVSMELEYVIHVPEHWTPDSIESHRENSSWCANNALTELAALAEHTSRDGSPCLCNRATFRYVGEATADDENECGVRAEDLPS